MNNIKNILRVIYKAPFFLYCWILVAIKLNDKSKARKFDELRGQYENIYLKLSQNKTLDRKSEGYHWDSWSGKIRSKFRKRVPQIS